MRISYKSLEQLDELTRRLSKAGITTSNRGKSLVN